MKIHVNNGIKLALCMKFRLKKKKKKKNKKMLHMLVNVNAYELNNYFKPNPYFIYIYYLSENPKLYLIKRKDWIFLISS